MSTVRFSDRTSSVRGAAGAHAAPRTRVASANASVPIVLPIRVVFMMILLFGRDEISVPAPFTRLGRFLFPFDRFLFPAGIFTLLVWYRE
jgi:hypothetical protein